jgi:hypothetical protein
MDRVSNKWVNGELEIIFQPVVMSQLRSYRGILVEELREATRNLPSLETKTQASIPKRLG